MISASSSATVVDSFACFSEKGSLDTKEAFRIFKEKFESAKELTRTQKWRILGTICSSQGVEWTLTHNKILKIAEKHDLILVFKFTSFTQSLRSQMRDYLERAYHSFDTRSDKESPLESLDQFSEFYIFLNKSSLEEARKKSPEEYFAELSLQLAQNHNFLSFHPEFAVEFCVPHLRDEKLIRKVILFAAAILPYQEALSCFETYFKKNYQTNLRFVAHMGSSYLPLKLAYAETVLEVDSDFLAEHFLYLFREQEIYYDTRFSSHLLSLFHELMHRMVGREDSKAHYFMKVKMYLERWWNDTEFRELKGGVDLESEIMRRNSTEIHLPADPKRPKDSPMWRQIGSIVTEEGEDHVFKLDWDFDFCHYHSAYARENAKILKNKGSTEEFYSCYYPAVQIAGQLSFFSTWWAEILGYRFQYGASGVYMTLPETKAVMNRWKKVTADEQARECYKELSIAEVEGSASVREFLRLFSRYDVICSMTTEFIHDHQFHLLPTINTILNSTHDEYTNVISEARASVVSALGKIDQARQRELSPLDAKMYTIMEIHLGIFADIYSNKCDIAERVNYANKTFQGEAVRDEWEANKGFMWREAFSKENIYEHAFQIENFWNKNIKEITS